MFVTLLTVIVMEQFCIGILISSLLKTESSQRRGTCLRNKINRDNGKKRDCSQK